MLSIKEKSTNTNIRYTITGIIKINSISALKVGKLAGYLGASRKTKEDNIDYGVGVKLLCEAGDSVIKGQDLALLYVNDLNVKLNEEDLKIFEIK